MDFSRPRKVLHSEPLQDLIRVRFLTDDRQAEAARRLTSAAQAVPALAALRHFPQTPPHHAEGTFVFSHLERSLTGLLALGAGETTLDAFEFASHHDLALDLASAEETAREHTPLLMAYLLAHVLGVDEGAEFTSAPGSKAHAEKLVGEVTATAVQHYEKLVRAHDAAPEEFFVGFGVRISPSTCSHQAWSTRFSGEREAILKHVGVSASYAKMLVELLHAVPRVREAFTASVDRAEHQVLVTQAGRAGLNHDLFLRLISACLLVDDVLGRLSMVNGRVVVPYDMLLNFFRAEHEVAPARRAARVQARNRREKDRVKRILSQAQLSAEEIFALLGTPFGQERGEAMRAIEEALNDSTLTPDFGSHTAEIARRLALARSLLSRDNGGDV